MPLTPVQEEQLCELLQQHEQQMLASIDACIAASSVAINQAARLAGLQADAEPGIDPQYLYALLHQHCFEQLHQGDGEVARVVAANQSSLVADLQ